MPRINFHCLTDVEPSWLKTIGKALRIAFSLTKPKQKKIIDVIFVTDGAIQEMNASYRKIDRPTDVLSFPNLDKNPELGDVFISVDRAKEQASAYGHSLDRELAFLAVHGFLHCLGYDHQDPEAEQAMFQLQEQILKRAKFMR